MTELEPPAKPQAAKTNLARSGSIVSGMTLISRVLGFVRDQVFAIALGAGAMTDAFFVAFKIPNFLRRLFAEGAFAQSFVPVFTEYKETRSRADLLALASRVSGTLAIILLFISALGSLFAPQVVAVFAPGFEADGVRRQLTSDMLRITFPYLFCSVEEPHLFFLIMIILTLKKLMKFVRKKEYIKTVF